MQDAEAKPHRRDDILCKIEQNHVRVKHILAELEATQPEMDRLIEILGDNFVLEEISKRPVTFSVSVGNCTARLIGFYQITYALYFLYSPH